MSDESFERLRAIRGGNREVIIKLVNEAEEILSSTTPLETAQTSWISVVSQQLDNKLEMLNEMDKDILGKCDVTLLLATAVVKPVKRRVSGIVWCQ